MKCTMQSGLLSVIIFFEGAPTVSKLNPIKIGKTVQK